MTGYLVRRARAVKEADYSGFYPRQAVHIVLHCVFPMINPLAYISILKRVKIKSLNQIRLMFYTQKTDQSSILTVLIIKNLCSILLLVFVLIFGG